MSKACASLARRIAVGLSLLLASGLNASPSHLTTTLTPHQAEYNVKISIVGGRLRTSLTRTEDGYRAEHRIKPTGMARLLVRGEISEVSEFASSSDGLHPLSYRSDDTLSRDKIHADIRFDRFSERAIGTVNGEAFEAAPAESSLDRVSIQYQLMLDLLNDKPKEQYHLFDIEEQKVLNIRNIGGKTVKVPAGTFSAIGIQHQAENSSRVTTLWCVEELGYLPVVIEQHHKGKLRVKATLRNYTPIN